MRALVLCALAACSSSPTTPTDGGADVVTIDVSQPASATFAMRRMFAGDSDRSFKPNADAWRTLGHDIDGRASTQSSTDVCTGGAQDDGIGGIDNAFGARIVPAIVALGLPSPSLQWSQATTQGAVRTGLVTTNGSSLEFRLGALPPSPPMFDGTGVLPISSLAMSQDHKTPNVVLSTGARADGPAIFTMPLNSGTLVLRIRKISIDTNAGVLSGVLDAEELVEAMRQVLGANKSACTGAMFDALASTIRGSKDILADGTQDPAKPCEAISIGLGFDTARMKLGDVVDDTGPAKSCP